MNKKVRSLQAGLPRHKQSNKQRKKSIKRKEVRYGARNSVYTPVVTNLSQTEYRALKDAKNRAHEAFDPIWSRCQLFTRTTAYFQLALRMGIPSKDAHIGKFNYEQCEQVIRIANDIKREYNIVIPEE